MDKAKQWVVLAVVAALALAAGGWFLLVQPKRDESALLRDQTEVQRVQNAQLETQLEVLRSKAAGLPEQQADLAEVAAKIPDAPELPELVRALTAAGRAAGVELTAITPGQPLPVAAEGATTEQAAEPVPGLTALPVTMQVRGEFYELEQFVAGLEDLPRALRVTGLTLGAADETIGGVLTSTVVASVFVAGTAPDTADPASTADTATADTATATADAAPAEAAAPAGPAAGAAPAVDSTPVSQETR